MTAGTAERRVTPYLLGLMTDRVDWCSDVQFTANAIANRKKHDP